jgi:diacylglycerol kinase family enzyme
VNALLLWNPVSTRSDARTTDRVARHLGRVADLEVVRTRAPGHATDAAAEAVATGCGLVVVLAGDGTMNEALQSVAGSDVAMASLPSGSTNVWARRAGFPRHPVRAARVLADAVAARSYRRVPLGMANGRWFAFGAGLGIDATVVRAVDAHLRRKRLFRQFAFVAAAISTLASGYEPPTIEVKAAGAPSAEPLAMVVCANSDPFTYLGPLPVRICADAPRGMGLGLLGLTRLTVPALARAVGSALAGDVRRRREVRLWPNIEQATLVSDRPVPLQVDGDDIGDTTVVDLRGVPDALTAVTAHAGRTSTMLP